MRFQFFGTLGAPNCGAGGDYEAMPASGGASRIPSPRKAAATGRAAATAAAAKQPAAASASMKTVSASRAAYLCVKETTAEDLASAPELEAALQHAGYNPSRTLLDRYWTSDTESVPYQEFHQILQVNVNHLRSVKRLHETLVR